MLWLFSSNEYRDGVLCEKNDGIEERYDDEGGGQGFIPLVCDGIIEMQQILKGIIDNSDEDDM